MEDDFPSFAVADEPGIGWQAGGIDVTEAAAYPAEDAGLEAVTAKKIYQPGVGVAVACTVTAGLDH